MQRADRRGGPARVGQGGRAPRPDDRAAIALTASRVAAANILADLRQGRLLDAAFDAHIVELDARDRRWTRELVFGLLRRRSVVDVALDSRVAGGFGRLDDDVLDILRLGVYQLLYMGSVPAYAAIGQTVELAKRRSGIGTSKLVNAVLRRVDRELAEIAEPLPAALTAEDLALEFSHPSWLVHRWIDRYGFEGTRGLLAANNEDGPLIARPMHVSGDELRAMLEASGVVVEPAPLVDDSLLLVPPLPSLTELGAFRQGRFFMQDPAATLVTRFAAFPAGASIADLCAAPGGKAAELSRTAATVIASDVSPARLRRVDESIRRMNLENVRTEVGDARAPEIGAVDGVLIDVPCSGTGTFRRHPDARWRVQPATIGAMSALQREIIVGAATAVAPGGLLVYSTCSLEPEENDDVVDGFLASHPEWREESPPASAVPEGVLDNGRLRVLPQQHGTDGAFAVRMRKQA